MTVSTVAQPARNPEAVDVVGQVRPLVDIAALCRRALLRNELLLNIAAAPRPAADGTAPARPEERPSRIGRPDLRWRMGPGEGEPAPAPRMAGRRGRPAGRPRVTAGWN